MPFPCCMNLSTGVRLASVVSLLLAAAISYISFEMFMESYKEKNSSTTRAIDSVSDSVNSNLASVGDIFGVETGKVNPSKVLNIKLFCSGAVLAAAALFQGLSAFGVFCCSFMKSGSCAAKLSATANTLTILVLGGVIACFFSAGGIDYKNDTQIQIFLGACAIDGIFLLYFTCVAIGFGRN